MPYEELLKVLNKFANITPGESSDALDYIFVAGEIEDLYSQYLDAKASSNKELMTEIGQMISAKVQMFCERI